MVKMENIPQFDETGFRTVLVEFHIIPGAGLSEE